MKGQLKINYEWKKAFFKTLDLYPKIAELKEYA